MKVGHLGDCQRVTAGAGSVRGAHQRLQIFDPRYRVWVGGHTRDCGSVIPGAGSGREVMLETVDM